MAVQSLEGGLVHREEHRIDHKRSTQSRAEAPEEHAPPFLPVALRCTVHPPCSLHTQSSADNSFPSKVSLQVQRGQTTVRCAASWAADSVVLNVTIFL